MAAQNRLVVFLNQLIVWFIDQPIAVRMAIIFAVILTAIMFSYSIAYAMPLGGGGGGCGC